MITKEFIGYVVLIILMLMSMAYFVSNSGAKELQQKIMQTEQTISSFREMAATYRGLSIHRDFTGINMASMKAKQLFSYDVAGTGATSTVAMPFDDTILMSIAPTNNNKGYILTVSLSANNDFDAVSKQNFEDKIYSDLKTSAVNITGYTSSSADGKLQLQFTN